MMSEPLIDPALDKRIREVNRTLRSSLREARNQMRGAAYFFRDSLHREEAKAHILELLGDLEEQTSRLREKVEA